MERSHTLFRFFFLFFVITALIHLFHLTLLSPSSPVSVVYFIMHASLQSFIQAALLYGIGLFLARWTHQYLFNIFIFLSFCILLTEVVDFFLVRFMSMPFWVTLSLIIEEPFDNFIEILQLTGFSLQFWIVISIGGLVGIPTCSYLLYALASKLHKVTPLPGKIIAQSIVFMPLLLFTLDLAFLPIVKEDDYFSHSITLPLKSTVLPRIAPRIALITPPSIPLVKKSAPEQLASKPNMYLFIVESLREDFLSSDVAPSIAQFREENITPGYTLSNANATQMSWYSIFHSRLPIHWSEARKGKEGAPSLRFLKEQGYKIRVYSSAQLRYYNMDELIFGSNLELADTLKTFPHYPPKEGYESDLEAFDAFLTDLNNKENETGTVFVVFLDATHFVYSWPKDMELKFYPAERNMSSFQLTPSEERLTVLKNSYRNSIYFIDGLFGKFISTLQEKNRYEESLIVFTGDHAEEFYEEGRLFHASHLSVMQTRVPIYYKLGDNKRYFEQESFAKISSHIDIFPTVIDFLCQHPVDLSLHGTSLLYKEHPSYVMAARYNGIRSPYEFFIHNGTHKCLFHFDNSKIYEASSVKLLKVMTKEDETLESSPERDQIIQNFIPALEEICR